MGLFFQSSELVVVKDHVLKTFTKVRNLLSCFGMVLPAQLMLSCANKKNHLPLNWLMLALMFGWLMLEVTSTANTIDTWTKSKKNFGIFHLNR